MKVSRKPRKYVFDLGHPAHFHLFRNFIDYLISKGDSVVLFIRYKDVLVELAKQSGYPYIIPFNTKFPRSIWGNIAEFVLRSLYIFSYCLYKDVSFLFSSCITSALAGTALRTKLYAFGEDDKDIRLDRGILFRIGAYRICIPYALKEGFGSKTLRYPGYHELAYLHPRRFAPDPSIYAELGLKEGDKFFVVRLVGFQAHHDVGHSGLSLAAKRKLVELLNKYGRVFISSESELPPEFEEYRITVAPHRIHNMLYYATMLIADSQTMTTEAAVLGTPAIRCNTFVGRCSTLQELEHRYGLTYGFRPEHEERMFININELLSMENLKEEWQRRRQKMLREKIDVTEWIVDFMETFCDSRT